MRLLVDFCWQGLFRSCACTGIQCSEMHAVIKWLKFVKMVKSVNICSFWWNFIKSAFFMAFISGHKWVFMYTFTVLVHMWKQQFLFCFWTIFRCSWKFICGEKLHKDISTCCNCSELLENVWQVLYFEWGRDNYQKIIQDIIIRKAQWSGSLFSACVLVAKNP